MTEDLLRPHRVPTRKRLARIDHQAVNNGETLEGLDWKLDRLRGDLSAERRAAVEDRTKMRSLWGNTGNSGVVAKIEDHLEKVDRKQNWIIGIGVGAVGLLSAFEIAHRLMH